MVGVGVTLVNIILQNKFERVDHGMGATTRQRLNDAKD